MGNTCVWYAAETVSGIEKHTCVKICREIPKLVEIGQKYGADLREDIDSPHSIVMQNTIFYCRQ